MPKPNSKPALRVADEAVKAKTGKTWREWFAVLDKAGARKLDHKQIVALCVKHGVGPWWQQMVTVGYEQARGLRVKHQNASGYEISKGVTLAAPVGEVFQAFLDHEKRERWLSNPGLTVRKATRNKYLRTVWTDGKTILNVNFYPKGPRKTQVSAQHANLSTAADAERMKSLWAKQLERLRAYVEG